MAITRSHLKGEAFLAFISPRVVQGIARESGWVRLRRKLDPVAFLDPLALENGPQLQRAVSWRGFTPPMHSQLLVTSCSVSRAE